VVEPNRYANFETKTKKKHKMKNTIILIAICLSVVITTKAETEIEKEVKQLILDDNAYALKNLKDKAKMISNKGSLEFWSSGGLLQSMDQDAIAREFDTYNLHPKHIKIIEVNSKTAIALYYVEGDYQQKESENNPKYLTRVMQVYVKEEGGWKIRAAHWSALTGGKGTTETAIKQ
jgi:hypothetical protein